MFQPFVQIALLAAASAAPATTTSSATALVSAPIQDATAPAAPKWTGNVSAGLVMTDGNSEMRQANASADATLKREKDQITLGFLWVYAENANNATNDWELTDRRTFGRGKYDYFFAEKTYAYGMLTAENDFLQTIALRWNAGAGLGHQFVDTATWKFALEAGMSYIDTDYKFGTDTDDVTVRIATNTTHVPSETWSFNHLLELYPSVEDTEDVYGRSQFSADAKLSANMIMSLKWIMDYDNTPFTGAERVDNRYLLSVGWKF
ncbi:MAG: DUF481 domain-containing protein [Gemmatimonadaceae bacterium]|jgi:putative salt-induced outer membrane protein YdiY|nr:DUF481 domain-containing protein [Gemmatimonadaceae bacterium]